MTAAWTLRASQAHLALASVEASIDLSQANVGLADVSVNSVALANLSLLGIFAPNLTCESASHEAIDAYVRQSDLVATFPEIGGERRRLQAYWRIVESELGTAEATVLELVVSVQTDLLDSHPAMYAVSKFPTSEFSQLAGTDSGAFERAGDHSQNSEPGFLLIRPNGSDVSFMQASHPADFAGVEVVAPEGEGDQLEFRHPLFADRLEKGVIRRSRVRVAILPRDQDSELAAACYRQFAASEPMLTA